MPPRESYRIGLFFTHKRGCGGAISVTKRSCTAPISKAENYISDTYRCSHYIPNIIGDELLLNLARNFSDNL